MITISWSSTCEGLRNSNRFPWAIKPGDIHQDFSSAPGSSISLRYRSSAYKRAWSQRLFNTCIVTWRHASLFSRIGRTYRKSCGQCFLRHRFWIGWANTNLPLSISSHRLYPCHMITIRVGDLQRTRKLLTNQRSYAYVYTAILATSKLCALISRSFLTGESRPQNLLRTNLLLTLSEVVGVRKRKEERERESERGRDKKESVGSNSLSCCTFTYSSSPATQWFIYICIPHSLSALLLAYTSSNVYTFSRNSLRRFRWEEGEREERRSFCYSENSRRSCELDTFALHDTTTYVSICIGPVFLCSTYRASHLYIVQISSAAIKKGS